MIKIIFYLLQVSDRTGELTAEMNIADLKIVLGISDARSK